MTDKIPYYLDKRNENLVDVINGVEYTEEWRPVVGFEGYYEVSSFGRVRSCERRILTKAGNYQKIKSRIMSLCMMKGYCKVKFHKNCKANKGNLVHRIIAEHFIPNPENKKEINHKNMIPSFNHISNLEWATRKENMEHLFSNYERKLRKGAAHSNSKLVLDTNTGVFYECLREAAFHKGIEYALARKKLSGYNKNKTGLIYA